MKIGAHVSAAVSLDLSIDRAKEIGAECMQIFVSPPQRWAQTKHGDEEIEIYKKKVQESGIGPNFIHGTYLVNLGTANPEHLQKSIDWLIYAMNMAAKLGIEGVIFHTGSHGTRTFEEVLPQVITAIKTVLEGSSPQGRTINSSSTERLASGEVPYLILENAAGAGNVIGDKFSELGEIVKGVDDPRLKICLDTCHTFASGYDVKTPFGLRDVLEEFEKEIGLKNLVAIHANDSKFELGQNKDRHANIGEGFIGREGFENIVNNPNLKDIPFILEVPGFSDNGPDKENVSLLKSLSKE